MRRPSRNNAICFESLEEAMAKSPEAYGCIDLMCAGWPCQDNSIAGGRKGLEGEKSGLWKEVARCLRLFKPNWFVGENVPGFLSVNNGRDFRKVTDELQEIGYGISWSILDCQYFGLAQRRERIFIVGRFGEPCPPEILFDEESHPRDYPPFAKVGEVGLCISTRDGERQDPSIENLVGFTLGTDLRSEPYKCHTENLVAKPLIASENKLRDISSDGGNYVSSPVRATDHKRHSNGQRGDATYVATVNPDREGEIAGVSRGLDSLRGVLIGNAVSIPVAKWIGKRIKNF